MPSAIWTGAIGFGLVQIPVKVVSATKSRDVTFNQLEAGSGARIRYKRVSDATGDEVPNELIVKGYEIAKGRYVVVEADELASLAPKAAHTVEIEEFVDLDRIDPLYFEQPYYVVPDEKGVKAYRLLVDAMTELDKVAVGRVVLRSKERLVAIRPLDGVLVLETMRYADEVLSRGGLLPEDGVELAEREKAMARQLVESLASEEFDSEKYHDEYRETLLGLIERKAAGEEIVAAPAPEPTARVLDLVAALEASLSRAGRDKKAEGGRALRAVKSAEEATAKPARAAKPAGRAEPRPKPAKVATRTGASKAGVKAVPKPTRAAKPAKATRSSATKDAVKGAAKKRSA